MSPWNRGSSYDPEPFVPNHNFWQPRKRLKRGYSSVVWGIVLILILCLFYLGIEAVARKARAHSPDHPEMNDWLMQATNSLGWMCCDGSEVIELSDSEWKVVDDHYEVFHEGRWWPIAHEQISPGGNRMSSALVWWYGGEPRCFKPATFY